MQGIEAGYRDRQQGVENERQNKLMGFQEQRLVMEKAKADRDAETAEAHQFGKAISALASQPPEVVAQYAPQIFAKHPKYAAKYAEYGIPIDNPQVAVKMLAQQYGDYDPIAIEKNRAAIGATNANAAQSYAQAQFYRSRAQANAAQQPASPYDPLAGAGINDEGAIVPPRGQATEAASFQVPDFVPNMRPQGSMQVPGTMITPSGPDFSGRMNLGGPMDDIERSMRLDEGRPQGVQVAQAGPPGNYGVGAGYGRSPVQQARQNSFGPTGMQSPEVPGIVTDAGRNRRTDVPATRAAEGQRAFEAASPEQQQRLQKFRQDQEMWTGVYKRQPRAGYYYGEDGREMPLTDKNFKGDKQEQAVALMNWNKIEAAADTLLGKRTGRVGQDGKPIREEGPYALTRAVQGGLNMGEIGQAYADMKQGALGIAYALSGKTVAVAEMKNFIEAYGPTPLDSPDRIGIKMERMKQFYSALLTASRGGESYEQAFARAMSVTGIKNPDGSPTGQPAAAGAGAPRAAAPNGSSLSTMSTDDLIRRLNGGR